MLTKIFCQESDFGVFNYEGSRLKGIVRYYRNKFNAEESSSYKYDDKGNLIGRVVRAGKNGVKVYESSIEYDTAKGMIKESTTKYIGMNQKVPGLILEYYYNNKKELVKFVRSEESIRNNKTELYYYQIANFEYNEKGDLTAVKEDKDFSLMHLPGDGLGAGIYNIIYENNKKSIYYLSESDKIFKLTAECLYKNNHLIKINNISYGKNSIDPSFFTWDNNKMIESIFVTKKMPTLGKNSQATGGYHDYSEKIKYDYDDKNRLIRRTIYEPDNIAKNKIDKIEEYFYEDGKYNYYPYLLPPKIRLYYTQEYEASVDKFVF